MTKTLRILVIDDEARHCQSLQAYLPQIGHEVEIAGSAERALELAAVKSFDAILLDIRLPGMDGLRAIPQLRSLVPNASIVIMTAFGTLDTAVSAAREGVFEYLVKPFTLDELKGVLQRAVETIVFSAQSSEPSSIKAPNEVVIGHSPTMQRIFNRIALVASSDVPVMLTGESGTGKEVLARAIHRHSSRNEKRFLPVFLAALSPGVIESELFGHARGAYTGAEINRPGLLEQAQGGTILLDELGDIPLSLQVKLLCAIEAREITRVGEDAARTIDARFIAATNKSLPDLIAKGDFREDLFYRLSVYHIELPPLRERLEDVPALAEHFLRQVAAESNCPGISESAMAELQSRPWYGNIRELRNAIEHAAIASRGSLISVSHLPNPMAGPVTRSGTGSNWNQAIQGWLDDRLASINPLTSKARLHDELMSQIERDFIESVLARCQNNQAAASRILGLDPKTIRAKLS